MFIFTMAFNKGSESNTHTWATENDISHVWGASSFLQENGCNNTGTGGGVNARTRTTPGGQGVFLQQTERQIEDTWGENMVNEQNNGKQE